MLRPYNLIRRGSMSPDPADPRNRRQIEDQLRKNVEEARGQYESARAKSHLLLEASRDLGLAHPDGNQAIRNATRVEAIANRNYADALYALSKFVLKGQIPRKPQDPE
jgi:hypothetical protein